MGADDNDDISPTLTARSDQLNADDLIGGPIVVRIEDVCAGDEDQPVVIRISGGHQPWKPGKTSRRCLAACWGVHARKWVGQWVELYRDPNVMFGGEKVGGIRVRAATGIEKPVDVMLTKTRGKKAAHRIEVLQAPPQPRQGTAKAGATLDSIRVALADLDVTEDDLRAFAAAQFDREVGPLSGWNARQIQTIADRLAGEWATALPGWVRARGESSDDGDGWQGVA